MTAAFDIGTLIVRTPGICGGRARIAGSRISVENIVIDFNAGMTPEQIIYDKPHLTLAKVYAALAYYYTNKAEIDADIATEQVEWERLEAEHKVGKHS